MRISYTALCCTAPLLPLPSGSSLRLIHFFLNLSPCLCRLPRLRRRPRRVPPSFAHVRRVEFGPRDQSGLARGTGHGSGLPVRRRGVRTIFGQARGRRGPASGDVEGHCQDFEQLGGSVAPVEALRRRNAVRWNETGDEKYVALMFLSLPLHSLSH